MVTGDSQEEVMIFRDRQTDTHHNIYIITIIIITNNLFITTRPKPAFGRRGLAGVSLCASGAQIGRMIVCDTQTDRQTLRHNRYVIILSIIITRCVCLNCKAKSED